jgi:hypothetical protein
MFSCHQEELKRRAEVEKLARERAKAKAQREEQERASRAVAGVNHLEIPAELAFIFSKLDGKCCYFVHISRHDYLQYRSEMSRRYIHNDFIYVCNKGSYFNTESKKMLNHRPGITQSTRSNRIGVSPLFYLKAKESPSSKCSDFQGFKVFKTS